MARSTREKSKAATSLTDRVLDGSAPSSSLTGLPTLRSSSSACNSANTIFRARSSSMTASPIRLVTPTTATRNAALLFTFGGISRCIRDDRRRADHISALGAKPQIVVHQHQRQHRLGDRRGANTDAGIVPSGGDDFDGFAVNVDGLPRQGDARGRLESQ